MKRITRKSVQKKMRAFARWVQNQYASISVKKRKVAKRVKYPAPPSTILNARPNKAVDEFVMQLAEVSPGIDKEAVKRIAITAAKHYVGKGAEAEELAVLQQKWYKALVSGTPDYGVYNDPAYMAELWACWVYCSRGHILSICNPNSLEPGRSVIQYLREKCSSVVDLGCGIAYTTAALKQLIPAARVFGTNIKGTEQWEFGKRMALQYGFLMDADVLTAGHIDMVFATEYFEHFERPVEHLHDIVAALSPTHLVLGNSFNTTAIGHFTTYKHLKMDIDQADISRFFNDAVRDMGYTKVKTRMWNNKPTVWSN